MNLHDYPVDHLPLSRWTHGSLKLPLGSQFAHLAVARCIQRLEVAAQQTHLPCEQVFERAISVWEVMSREAHQISQDRWLNEVCAGIELGLEALQEIYAELLWQALHNYEDILGGIYSKVRPGRKHSQQFFTPLHVARFIASLQLEPLPDAEEGKKLRILDPACGSGVLLLAAAEYIECNRPELLDLQRVDFIGYDLDSLCVSIAQLNLRIHLAGRRARYLAKQVHAD